MPDFAAEFERLSGLLERGLSYASEKVLEYAEAERVYRLAQAKAWLEAPRFQDDVKVTAGEREAWVMGQTADLRRDRDAADGLRQVGLEAVRSRRAQLSALQSQFGAHREEAALARTAP